MSSQRYGHIIDAHAKIYLKEQRHQSNGAMSGADRSNKCGAKGNQPAGRVNATFIVRSRTDGCHEEQISCTKRYMATRHTSGESKIPLSSLPTGFKVTSKLHKFDSGCTSHIVYSKDFLDDYVEPDPPTELKWGYSAINVKAMGTGTLVTNNSLPDESKKRVEF